MWLITISSQHELSDAERDFIADLVNNEPQDVQEPYYFTVHDIWESRTASEILMEGTDAALENLLAVPRGNLSYDFSCQKLD